MSWEEVFYYENETGKLRWKSPLSRRLKIGDIAGSQHHSGYVQVYFKGKCHQRSRIVWELHHGEIPEGFNVDHINAIRNDDRIENLQLLTQTENVYKGGIQTGRSHNRSGHNGVCWHVSAGKWVAYITIKGKRKHLGLFDSVKDAAEFREKHEIAIDGIIL